MKSSLTYERMAQGELPSSEEDRPVLEQLRAENREYLERHPPVDVRLRPRAAWWVPAAAVLAVSLWGLWPQETDRIKSTSQSLQVYHKTASGTELLKDGASLGEGDEVQLAFRAEHRYRAILSVDGRAAVTMHLPLESDNSPDPGRARLLPYAYVLDDAPAFEVVLLVSSDHDFDVEAVVALLKAWASHPADALALPADLDFTVFHIQKKESSR